MKKFLIALFFLFSVSANAAVYTVDYPASSVSFSGTHADNAFTGKFEKWTAEIDFNPAHLDTGHIKATFDTSSAKTGNKMYDGTLPEADWFDVKQFPKAEFVSTSIKENADKTYEVAGNLTIRNITHPVTFKFTLSDLSKSPVKAKGETTINRLDYDLGKKSDDSGEWVGKDIKIELEIVATPVK